MNAEEYQLACIVFIGMHSTATNKAANNRERVRWWHLAYATLLRCVPKAFGTLTSYRGSKLISENGILMKE